MRGKTLLYLIWVLTLIAVVLINERQRNELITYYGIADSREIVINAENPVEIKEIYVIPGQTVHEGDLLVELSRPELDIKINEISHQLDELKVQRDIDIAEARSQINQLKAQKNCAISEVNYKIKQLQARRNMNKELAYDLNSIDLADNVDIDKILSPVDLEIESLNKELELALGLIQIKEDTLNNNLNSPENPLTIQIKSLEKELKLLKEQNQELLTYSSINGIVGSVNFKKGANVSPFAPILTLCTKSPSYIAGYIHENLYNRVSVGDEVRIASITSKEREISGKVVGVGSRIIECPVRLRKRPDIQVWGREVQVKIPNENKFLLGEKVVIKPLNTEKLSYWAKLKNWLDIGMTYAAGIVNLSKKANESE